MNSSAAQPTRQFTVRYLILLTGYIALCLLPAACWGALGLIASVGICAFGLSIFHKHYSLAWLLGLLLMFAVLLPSGPRGQPARRTRCVNNIRQISLALLNYEADHGHLPPPYSTDDQGRPLHSWRVLILPYMEEDALYEAIDLTKPWDDPVNLALATEMPSCYRCPSFAPSSPALEVTTSYVAVVGDGTAWPRSGARKMSEITDGPSKTLAILESEKHRLHWMSTADPGVEMISGDETQITNHNGGVIHSRCDGSVLFLSSDIDAEGLLSLISIEGSDGAPKD